MKYTTSSMLAIGIGIAMVCLVGCTPTTHVTETTTTREYDTTNPPVMAPATNSNTTTTTRYQRHRAAHLHAAGSLRASGSEHNLGND